MKFGDNLKKLRKLKKISQEELAEKVGVSRQSVSKWECGEAYPEMSNILALCSIFKCKMNELVQEDMKDIDSLDEEIKMSIVKFKKEKQDQVKLLSKLVYIFSRIGKIASLLGILAVVITYLFMTVSLIPNTKLTEQTITIYNEEIDYSRLKDENIIEYDGKKYELKETMEKDAAVRILDILEKNGKPIVYVSLTTIFISLIATLVLLYFAFKHIDRLFVNIHDGETPFTLENVKHIKMIAYFMIGATLTPNILGVITEFFIGEELGIGFELIDLIYILVIFSMAYIFEYGYEIQLDSKGRMYGETEE